MQERSLTTTTTPQVGLTPKEVIDGATIQAKLLMDIVEQTKCFQTIANKKYLQVEAWETIGAFNRTHAETDAIEPIIQDGATIGYKAHVQLFKDGQIVGGAWMPCYFTENCCKGKEGDAKHKACMSAAQTFATSKAYRMNYSFVAILAGYEPTPAEEMSPGDQPLSNKNEHWCSIHKTGFFMKGKMKSYAHPIKDANGKDTGEWCHEETKKPEAPATPNQPGVPPEPINWDNKGENQAELSASDAQINEMKEIVKAQGLDQAQIDLCAQATIGKTFKRKGEITLEQGKQMLEALKNWKKE